jgi:hypothetical protein
MLNKRELKRLTFSACTGKSIMSASEAALHYRHVAESSLHEKQSYCVDIRVVISSTLKRDTRSADATVDVDLLYARQFEITINVELRQPELR